MKNILTFLSLFFCSFFAFAQNDCEEFINKMVNDIKSKNIENAKESMKGYIICKEETLGKNNQRMKNINKIRYFISEFVNNNAIVQGNDFKYYLVDKYFNFKLLNYESIYTKDKYNNCMVSVGSILNNNDKYGLIDSNGKIILETKYDHIFEDSFGYLVEQNNKWGLFSSGKFLIEPKYIDMPQYIDNLGLIVKNIQNKYGVVDINDKIIIPFIYDFIGNKFNVDTKIGGWNNKYISCVKNNKFGIVDYNNNIIYDFKFDRVTILDDFILFSESNKACYLLNTLTNYKSDPLYYDIQYITDVTNDKKEKGYKRMPLKGFYKLDRYKEGANDGVTWSIINEEGKEVSNTFRHIYNSSENFVKLDLGSKTMSFFNLNNLKLINNIYEDIRDFSEGIAAVKKDGKWGFIDFNGNLIIDYKYINPYNYHDYQFSNGLVRVSQGFSYFFINTKGECIKDCENAPADHPRAKN